eukprot:1771419-Karenia_brevis.AAC.1
MTRNKSSTNDESSRTNGSIMQNPPCENPWNSKEKPMKLRGDIEPSARTSDSNRFDEKESVSWPNQMPRSIPRMPRRITNCNGCG